MLVDHARPSYRRSAIGATIALIAVLALWSVALAHATLVSAEPAAGSRLPSSPTRLRLVFSEPVEVAMAQVSVVAEKGISRRLVLSGDPHDVHALISPLRLFGEGMYRVEWHVVSADGHPVGGSYTFGVGSGTGSAPSAASDTVTDEPEGHLIWGPGIAGAPAVPALLRGLGVGCVMASLGLLVFLLRSGLPPGARVRTMLIWSTFGGALLLVGHLVAWLANAAPDHRLDVAWAWSASSTLAGQVEFWRAGLALGIVWSLWLARRPGLSVIAAVATLLVSAAAGHSAAFSPLFAVPAKALHLLAASAWLGGLLWLALHARDEPERVITDAPGVSRIALIAVIVVVVSGVVQTLLVLPEPLEQLRSAYGAVIGAKCAGLVALVAFGAYHRQGVLPRLQPGADRATIAGFGRTLTRETALFAIVVLLGGLLAYIPPPEPRFSREPLHETSR